MRTYRRLLAAATVAVTLAGALTVGSRADRAEADVGGITWSDEFNGAAGAAVDGAKWGFDTGGGGFGNNELEYYTTSTRNVAMDGQGHLAITARRENPANYQCWYGTCQYTSAGSSPRAVHPAVRPVRGEHQDPQGSGPVAGVLDARRQHRQRRLAHLRRDRHHGEHRQDAEHRLRHRARPRLLRRERRGR